MTDYTVKRDYWDKPIVMPPDAGPLTGEWRSNAKKTWWWSADGKGYGRASGAGKGLDDKTNLIDWAACQAAVGVMLDASARSEVVTLINEYDADPWNKGDDGSARSGKDRLKAAVEQARNTAGQHVASSAGTEFHYLGELHNAGKTPRVVQEHLREPFEKYKKAVAPIKFLAQEILVVNDELELAGSPDYLTELPPGLTTPDGIFHSDPIVCVADLKTGKWDARYPLGVTTQLAAYGTGCRYDQENNVRTPLHPNINTDWGVMVHFPIREDDPDVHFYWVDLQLGLRAARIGKQVETVRSWFKRKESKLIELELV